MIAENRDKYLFDLAKAKHDAIYDVEPSLSHMSVRSVLMRVFAGLLNRVQ